MNTTQNNNRTTPRWLRTLTAAVVALPVAIGVGASPASATDFNHEAYASGQMILLDSETFGSDEKGEYNFPEFPTRFGTATSTTGYRQVGSHCVGGELLGRAKITFVDTGPTTAQFWIDARLYEGSSCNTTDLDGQKIMGPYSVSKGQTTTASFLVTNTDEGGDWVHFEIQVRLAK